MEESHVDEIGKKIKGIELTHHLRSLLSSSDRDFLIRNNGDQVQIDSLKGKKVGLYFSGSCCSPLPWFTPKLVEVYNALSSKGDFEIVFASADGPDDESFRDYFSKMPWLAIPFSDSVTSGKLITLFEVRGIPFLVILDENGKVLTTDGVEIIQEYGVDGYPFANEKIRELKEQEERARREQSLTSLKRIKFTHDIRSLLYSSDRDFLIRNNGDQVQIESLKGKKVGLYFSGSWCVPCRRFTPKLVEVYSELSSKGDFEIVFASLDGDDRPFKDYFSKMPWLAIPFSDSETSGKLIKLFEVRGIPFLVILDENGKILTTDGVEIIQEYGVDGYPFTNEKIRELKEQEERARREESLKSILVSHSRDCVVSPVGKKVGLV